MTTLRFFMLLLLAGPALLLAQMNVPPYTIIQSSTGQPISIEELADQCLQAGVVFWGEEHDDSLGHALQAQLFALLHARKPQLALSMEMFETDAQLVLNEYLAGFIPESRFLRDARPWDTYQQFYRPMVEFAKAHNLPVIAANAPRRYVSMVSKQGKDALKQLPKASLQYLPPLPYDTLEGAYRLKFEQIMAAHGSTLPAQIYHSQNLWDASMAWQIARFHKKNKQSLIFHLCGRFHSDERLGTVAHLQAQQPKLKVLTISCFRDSDEEETEPAQLADFVIRHP